MTKCKECGKIKDQVVMDGELISEFCYKCDTENIEEENK